MDRRLLVAAIVALAAAVAPGAARACTSAQCYRLVLRAIDRAGNHAQAKRLTFTVAAR